MAKGKRFETPSGRNSAFEEEEKFESAGRREARFEEPKSEEVKYSRSDLDKIRQIHALAIRLYQAMGLPWAAGFVPQPQPAVLQSGYTYSPGGFEHEATPLYGWGAAPGAPPCLGASFSPPILPQQPMYVAAYPAWSPLPGMTWQ